MQGKTFYSINPLNNTTPVYPELNPSYYITDPFQEKSGRYQVLLQNSILAPIQPEWISYYQMSLRLSGNSTPGQVLYSIGAHNYYDNFARMNGGMLLYNSSLFTNSESYYLEYDSSPITAVIGSNNSPIRIGNQVPQGAINLARISSPPFSAENSLSIIDLSHTK